MLCAQLPLCCRRVVWESYFDWEFAGGARMVGRFFGHLRLKCASDLDAKFDLKQLLKWYPRVVEHNLGILIFLRF